MITELIKDIASQYDFNVIESYPTRHGIILSDGKNKKILSKTRQSVDRIKFNHYAKEHLAASGFPYTDRYVVNKNNLPYIIINDITYTLTNKIDGRECSFDNSIDLARSATALASIHVASVGTKYPQEYSFAKRDLGAMPKIFQHRLDELKRFKKLARKGKGDFDYIFLNKVDYFINEAEETLESLLDSAYFELVEQANKDNTLCHHDFTQHNVVLTDKQAYVTGFNNCCIQIKEYDIANFLRRKMRKCDWNLSIAKYMLDHYRTVCKIREEEFQVLRIILRFPQKLWRIANRYYNSRRAWCEKSCLSKLDEVLDEAEPLKNFLKNFDLIY